MRIVVRASETQKDEWLCKPAATGIDLHFTDSKGSLPWSGDADVYFDLLFDINKPAFPNNGKPVFINAVVELLNELPDNYIRINAWNGFLIREIIEIVAAEKDKPAAAKIIEQLGWKYVFVPDIRGMIAARSICMIINEAYYALGDEVSSKQDIDTAMKLGTNYPYGPFEWSEKIGLQNIYRLLNELSVEDDRYIIATCLKQELTNSAI